MKAKHVGYAACVCGVAFTASMWLEQSAQRCGGLALATLSLAVVFIIWHDAAR